MAKLKEKTQEKFRFTISYQVQALFRLSFVIFFQGAYGRPSPDVKKMPGLLVEVLPFDKCKTCNSEQSGLPSWNWSTPASEPNLQTIARTCTTTQTKTLPFNSYFLPSELKIYGPQKKTKKKGDLRASYLVWNQPLLLRSGAVNNWPLRLCSFLCRYSCGASNNNKR